MDLLAACTACGSIDNNGTWISLAPIANSARQEHATVSVSPTTLYILGGILPFLPNQATDPTTAIMQSYFIPNDTWRSVASLPMPLNHINAAATTHDGKIYLLGALAPSPDGVWRAVANCWVYDPQQDTWEALAPMPVDQARGSAAVGVSGNMVYLAGGLRSLNPVQGGLQETVDMVTAYDTVERQWTVLPPAADHLPAPRDHAGAAVVEDTFYVLGGREQGQANVRDTVFALDLWDLRRGWRTSAFKMPTPRGGIAAGVVGGKVYTFGGEGNPEPGSQGMFNQTEVYDTVRDSWERLAPMRVPKHGTSAVGLGGKIFIPGGGVAEGGAPVDTFDVFEP
jgi:N-acetylneuraminic acid mutarotase